MELVPHLYITGPWILQWISMDSELLLDGAVHHLEGLHRILPGDLKETQSVCDVCGDHGQE